MIEYQPKFSMQQTDDGISMKCEYDISEIADEFANRIRRDVDAAVLDMVADILAEYGYVKAVRCRDCEHYDWRIETCWGLLEPIKAAPEDFCAWGVRKLRAEL